VAARLKGTGQVAIMSGNSGATTDESRVAGFESEIKANYPHISVVGIEYSLDSISTAATQARTLILKYPNLKGIFAVDGNTATGAANAISATGKTKTITLAGYDAEPAAVKLLKAGAIQVLVIQDFWTEGKLGVEYAYDVLAGKTVPKSVSLKDIIATAANDNNPAITKYYYRSSC
jgi:ribose transport system substrate-binding protein